MEFHTGSGLAISDTYLVFHEDVKCKDGRIFHVYNNILIAVDFIAAVLDIEELANEATNYGLEDALLVNHYDLIFSNLEPDEAVKEKARRFITEKDLIAFLEKMEFVFEDGTVLTQSKLDAGVEKMKKRLGIVEPESESVRKSRF